MRSARKKIVHLQRLIQRTDTASVMQSVSGIYFAHDVAHKPAAYQPRELPVIGSSSVRKGLDSGKWHAAFLVPMSKIYTQWKSPLRRRERPQSLDLFGCKDGRQYWTTSQTRNLAGYRKPCNAMSKAGIIPTSKTTRGFQWPCDSSPMKSSKKI